MSRIRDNKRCPVPNAVLVRGEKFALAPRLVFDSSKRVGLARPDVRRGTLPARLIEFIEPEGSSEPERSEDSSESERPARRFFGEVRVDVTKIKYV